MAGFFIVLIYNALKILFNNLIKRKNMPDLLSSENLRLNILGDLMKYCPINKDNPKNCLLHYIRTRPVEEKILFLNKLTDEDCKNIYIKHQICFHEKTVKIL